MITYCLICWCAAFLWLCWVAKHLLEEQPDTLTKILLGVIWMLSPLILPILPLVAVAYAIGSLITWWAKWWR